MADMTLMDKSAGCVHARMACNFCQVHAAKSSCAEELGDGKGCSSPLLIHPQVGLLAPQLNCSIVVPSGNVGKHLRTEGFRALHMI